MRVAFSGPRDLKISTADVAYAISRSGFDVTFIVVGDCPTGVDDAVRKYAKSQFPNDHRVFEAHWKSKGYGAGPYRNMFMINKGGAAEALIAFVRNDGTPVTKGTGNAIAEAVVKGIPIHIVKV